ncbi:anaerobic ribonucleoside-triphosphate reductase NrdD [Thermacetogenium phaeum DSM 12270]|uniref:Anaerobic ribonucleoside-triphosphate reductase NrdD n=1 Tax=Thermacetogenium phaeum (strain ATCC BAA-254 / DSM 26808 / PB) TaxID=1089553 RepID=K4LF72_THEPS|nr:anaerobic ribonucleoside-triphosphate reductase [Thermacetogenium phaeum]AFV11498.1 anaerobic ribonucleoside-triphosphate reductase NrdD [Thermacetogenium phaeum DSM 12270]
MFTKIRKRDGREVPFDDTKITDAIFKAARAVGGEDRETAVSLTLDVLRMLKEKYNGQVFSVEDVQDVVEKVLIERGHARTAKAYILYRDKRTRIREAKTELMDVVEEIIKETDRDNANVGNSPSAKMLQIASAASKNYYLNRLLDEDFSLAHRRGDIHIHDLDFYATTLNCLQIPLDVLLKNGFDNGHGYIRPPKRPSSATALAAIILQSSQNDMYGGQSFPFFDRQMAPFVEGADDDEVYQAMEALVYNLNSMHSRAGSQVPFSSLNLGTDTSEAGRKVTRNLLLAYEAGLGHGENPIFPNVIFRLKKGVNFENGDPNYDLFQLAVRVASKRLNPTFSFMDSSFNRKYGDQVAYMGCRTRVMANRRGPEETARRGNLSFTTINLPRLAIKAERNMKLFYSLLDEMVELAIRQLYHRFKVQCRLRVKDIPFVMGQRLYMGSEDLKPEDSIEPAIVNGTLSVGIIGLAETLVSLTGYHHGQSEESQAVGLEIVKHIREKVNEACERFDLNYTFLATPAEGLCGRFIALDRKEFGIIPGVTDKEYYTNSFHIPVNYPISIFDKIRIEGEYHKYFDAGHISYVELASPPQHNQQAVEAIIRHMADCDMGYAGINYPVDFCCGCNLLGVINESVCPRCGSSEIRRVRRITGYLSTVDRFNDGKLAELRDRITHFQ